MIMPSGDLTKGTRRNSENKIILSTVSICDFHI